LGNKYNQNAIVIGKREEVAKLEILDAFKMVQ
jgi:hypothetical protein